MSGARDVNMLRTELLQVSSLVDEQTAAGMDRTDMISSHYESMLSMGANLENLSSADVLALTKASNNGPWTDHQKQELCRLFDARKGSAKSKKKKGQTQKCIWFENMIPTPKMAMIRTKRLSRLSRAQVIAECARDIGLHSPDESTLFRMVSILFWSEISHDIDDDDDHAFTQDDVFDWMNKIQSFIKAKCSAKHVEMPFLLEYPVCADMLPKPIKASYGDEVPPEVQIPQLDTILADKNKRGKRNPKGAEKSRDPPWMKNLSEADREQARRDLCQVKIEQPNPKAKAAPHLIPASSYNAEDDARDKLVMLASRVKQDQLVRSTFAHGVKMEPDKKKEEEDTKTEVKEEPDNEHDGHEDTSIDDMENHMIAAAKARATDKKAKKRPASCGTIPPMKRPAIAKAAAEKKIQRSKPSRRQRSSLSKRLT